MLAGDNRLTAEVQMKGEIKISRMRADGQDPFVGVHALTEFIYCPRAGILAFELEHDHGSDEQPNLSSLPRWSLARIERRLHTSMRQLVLFVTMGVTVIVLLAVFHQDLALPVTWGCVFLVLAIARRTIGCAQKVRVLFQRYRLASQAVAYEPAAHHPSPQSVNWWSLLGAGFESIAYKDALRDEQWKLIGRPWRVLRKGSLRIPVFITKGCSDLRRQHFARMSAYCHLLIRCEGAKSPYGVVIDHDTYQGWTIPYTAASRKVFHDGLIAARATIRKARMGVEPGPASNCNVCRRCPFGRPRVHRKGKTETKRDGRLLRVNGRMGVDRRMYHSPCGDRFGWVPPHEKAFSKGLL